MIKLNCVKNVVLVDIKKSAWKKIEDSNLNYGQVWYFVQKPIEKFVWNFSKKYLVRVIK